MVEVTRSKEVESVHYGNAVLINSSGEVLKEWGNSDLLIYPRSALKPIQSLNLYICLQLNDHNVSRNNCEKFFFFFYILNSL